MDYGRFHLGSEWREKGTEACNCLFSVIYSYLFILMHEKTLVLFYSDCI
jgi:hypothetical protein